jgi:hypothetical protein
MNRTSEVGRSPLQEIKTEFTDNRPLTNFGTHSGSQEITSHLQNRNVITVFTTAHQWCTL